MEYKIVTGTSIGELNEIVNHEISRGWTSQGGVTVSSERNEDKREFYQAMTK